jgi:tetratricopeptide (TPR) repeat protein
MNDVSSCSLSVDPSSAEAGLEQRFFEEGVRQEQASRQEAAAAAGETGRGARGVWLAATAGVMVAAAVAFLGARLDRPPRVPLARPSLAAAPPIHARVAPTTTTAPPAPSAHPAPPEPPDARRALRLARVELDRGHTARAVSLARKALAAAPNLPEVAEAYVIVGEAEQQSGRAPAARAAYLRYLALAPDGEYARDLRIILRNL